MEPKAAYDEPKERMFQLDLVLNTTSDKDAIAWMKSQLLNSWKREKLLLDARNAMELELVAVIQQSHSRGIQRAVIGFLKAQYTKLTKGLEELK